MDEDVETGLCIPVEQLNCAEKPSPSITSSVAQPIGQPLETMPQWFKSERFPMVVFVSLKVSKMTVSAVLSELNLTATVRNIHGSFTKTKKSKVDL